MSKIRINDLARELEVKSKAVLDSLTELGITEKKTHSSSVELDEAEKIRRYFTRSSSGGSSSAARTEEKPKIDLSKVSKPGDVAALIRKKMEEQHAPAPPRPAAPPAARPAPPPSAPPAVEARPAAPPPAAPAAPAAPSAPPKRVITPASVATPRLAPPIVHRPAPPAAEAPAPPAPSPAAPPPAQQAAPPAPPPPAGSIAAASRQQGHPAAPTSPPASATPAAPPPQVRRVITPQTGPRPVYTAAPVQPSAPRPGGLPVRGQPIFPRRTQAGAPAGAPGQRPPMPGGPRRTHPVGQRPGGGMPPRPGFPGRPGGPGRPGLLPANAPPGTAPGPTRRPGGGNRRPGQKYIPPRVKEGPMKGFTPPPRYSAQLSAEPLPITRTITIPEGISVKDLAEKLEVRAKDLIARLLARGVMATVNQTLDAELARQLARQFGADTDVISFEEQMAKEMGEGIETAKLPESGAGARAPVVTIMGHVDHGKTSLLDAVRETDVAGGEAGGITQHIGAYKVKIAKEDSPAFGRQIVFLDTPGHEAFTRMRARGAKVTDIVVIVVAADDGVMPQTLEAIDHAKAAKVPMIVAVNKIDKPDAQPDRVKKQLGDRGLLPEDWGGTTVFVEVSAKTRKNLDLLLEMICLVADVQGLKASPDLPGTGSVIEAKLDRGRGNVATVLVQNGTMRTGDSFIVGNTFGRVRAMFDDRGNAVGEAGPSTPVEVLGLEGLPQAGDTLLVVADRDKAKGVSEYREGKAREAHLAKSARVSLEGLAEQIKSAGTKELPIILKGDVQGSVEVLADSLQKLSTEKVKIRVLRTGVGAITESDVLLASASNAIIIGFNVRPERKAQDIAEQEGVDIRLHSIIYELQDEIRKAMLGLLEPVVKETYMGRAEVRNTFRIPKVGTIAGSYVQDGTIKRDANVRLLRDNVVVYTGKVGSLRRFKDDASEVRNGMECGIGIAGYGDIKVGDVIEAFVKEMVAAELTA